MSFSRLILLLPIVAVPVLAASVELVKINDLSRWNPPAMAGVGFEQAPAAVRFKIDAVDGQSPRKFDLRLKSWVSLPEGSLRAGLWVYVVKNPALDDAWLTVVDAKGREFEYTLPRLESWQPGWQYLETFAFDANEMGRLHPQVGRLAGGGAGLPEPPLQLTGIRFAAKASTAGEWLLGGVTADAHTLGKPGYHWALNIPGRRYNMTQTWIQSGVEPWLMAGQLLPAGGDEIVSWEVLSGFQGVPLSRGEQRLTFTTDDYQEKARRMGLGALPKGDYDIVVTRRPADMADATPAGWTRLVWRATGRARWEGAAENGARVLRGEKTGGSSEGSAGWRQMVAVSGGPGRYEFSVTGGGSGRPVARLVPLGRDMKNIGGITEIVFASGRDTGRVSRTIELPAGVEKIQLDLMATQTGDAAFSSVSLKKGDVELVMNGDAGAGDVLRQERWKLVVVSSPDQKAPPGPAAISVPPGEPLAVPAPSWAELPGGKRWRVLAEDGTEVAGGAITGHAAIRWVPPAEGCYRYIAERTEAGVVVDRDVRTLGGRTDPAGIGAADFTARLQVPTEDELFGPGKNYFTWAMYENHPDLDEFFTDTRQWIKDGRAAGFELMRIRADWDKIERLPGVFDFKMLDRVIEEVRVQGGKVILELRFETPDWMPVEHQLNNYGRADVWRPGRVGRIPSVWTPGMLESIRDYTVAAVRRYRNNPAVVGYHVWGLPGSLDWTTIDKPYWGQRADYSDAAVAAFDRWSQGRHAGRPPMASEDWNRPDLSEGWRDWTGFRRYGLETFFIDHVLKPIRELDDRRSIIGYFGLDFLSERLTESARSLRWRRHTGGSELYYQIPLQARRAVVETGMAWPHEVHLLTPVPAGLEQATFQMSGSGGQGYHWNFYWRNNFPVGTWTAEREAGLSEWRTVWAPLWAELRDAVPAQAPDLAAVHTWSTMHYGLRTYFPLRMADYVTRPAAAMYRDHLAPDWFSDNASRLDLSRYKLIVVPPVGAQVMPRGMAGNLVDYVTKGGNIVIFPDSGRWVIEEPEGDGVLWTRLGWRSVAGTGYRAAGQSAEVGNSGLPMNAGEDPFTEARPAAGGPWFADDQPLVIRQSPSLRLETAGPHRVDARFPDGSPAIISWQHGQGHVIAFAGQPDWTRTPGLMAALHKASGGTVPAKTSRPDVEITHLMKGDVHYAILHRLPDSFRPHLPMPIPDLDRAVLRKMTPRTDVLWSLANLPGGARWKISELTGLSDQGYASPQSSEELAKGLSARLYLAQTLVFKLEPVTEPR